MDAVTVKTSLGYLFSTALVANGMRGIFDPVAVSKGYGLPTDGSKASYVPPTCARGIAIGRSIGAPLYQNDKRAAGTVLSTAFVVGGLDTWITYRYAEKWTGPVLNHVFGDAMCGAVGLWLMA